MRDGDICRSSKAHRLLGLDGVSEASVRLYSPLLPLGPSSPSPCSHACISRSSPHRATMTVKGSVFSQISGHRSQGGEPGCHAGVARFTTESGKARLTLPPSLPPATCLDQSCFQPAQSLAPALRTTLTPSVTPEPMWNTSHPARQAAQAGWSRRVWTKVRWVWPLTAPPASPGLCPALSLCPHPALHLCAFSFCGSSLRLSVYMLASLSPSVGQCRTGLLQ